jgi:hypothetical protein
MARLEPQRPRHHPRQQPRRPDDDNRPRPQSGPAPRMRFDPW